MQGGCRNRVGPELVQIQMNRLVQTGAAPFQQPDIQSFEAGFQQQAQRCNTVLCRTGRRPQTEKQSAALACGKMQAMHRSRVRLVEPAQQGGARVVLQYFFSHPQRVASAVCPDPEYTPAVRKPLAQTYCRRNMGRVEKYDAAVVWQAKQRRLQQLYFARAGTCLHDFDQNAGWPAPSGQLGIQFRITGRHRFPARMGQLRPPPKQGMDAFRMLQYGCVRKACHGAKMEMDR